MKKFLIIQASSRLGMKYLPHGGTALNFGVEKGPSAVLSQEYMQGLTTIADCTTIEYTFSDPESMESSAYYATIAKETNELALIIEKELSCHSYDGVVTVGGDHSIALSSTLAILRHFRGQKTGVIDFDSHGDIHLVKTSPSGNFHGMWLRPILGEFDNPEIQAIIDITLLPHDFLYIGDLLTEPEEERFIQEKNITHINKPQLENTLRESNTRIANFCTAHERIHVTFDIDVFKQSLVNATGTPNPNGLDIPEVTACIQTIVNSDAFFSLDVVEVNPEKDGAPETIALAQSVIRQFLKI